MRGEYNASIVTESNRLELPPRARRIQRFNRDRIKPVGTTSACAENTNPHDTRTHARWNYLRVRGEYVWCGSMFGWGLELPPRARRIHLRAIQRSGAGGTTSACAENTGEKHRVVAAAEELPPRARRILHSPQRPRRRPGTTSACAENTGCGFETFGHARNYLRVRGEYSCTRLSPGANWELPPRARRIQFDSPDLHAHHGTTSACAENTL